MGLRHNDTFLNRRKRYHKQDIEIILNIKEAIDQREKDDDNLTFKEARKIIEGITGAKDGSSRFYKILHLGFFYKRSRYYPEHSKTLDVVKYSEDFDTLFEVYSGLEIKNFDKDIITHFNQTLKLTQEQGV